MQFEILPLFLGFNVGFILSVVTFLLLVLCLFGWFHKTYIFEYKLSENLKWIYIPNTQQAIKLSIFSSISLHFFNSPLQY